MNMNKELVIGIVIGAAGYHLWMMQKARSGG
jgi:hypothetical protein